MILQSYAIAEPVLWIFLQGRDATPSRPRNVHDDGHEAKSNIDEVPSSQV